jgi:hypothetical protein
VICLAANCDRGAILAANTADLGGHEYIPARQAAGDP